MDSTIIFNEIKNENTAFIIDSRTAKLSITIPSINSNLLQIFQKQKVPFTSELHLYNNTNVLTFVNKDVVLLFSKLIENVICDPIILKKYITLLIMFKDINSSKIVLYNYFKNKYTIIKKINMLSLTFAVYQQDNDIINLLKSCTDIMFTNIINESQKRNELIFTNSNILDILSFMIDDLYKTNIINSNSHLLKEYLQMIYNPCPENTILECKFEKVDYNAVMPTKKFASDVGYDLTIIKEVKKLSKDTIVYDTGIKVIPPFGYYTEVVPRSSLAKSNVFMSNSIGIIDSSYRGTLLVALTIKDQKIANIQLPFKCCQLILKKHNHFIMSESNNLDNTVRGDGAMGSTDQM